MSQESWKQSYARHQEHENSSLRKKESTTSFCRPDNIDSWLHWRMLSSVLPLLESFPDARWMTVGDGRYGQDAAFLKEEGAHAVATSLTSDALREAQESGFIDAFSAENAEDLSPEDDAFDFVLCKQAYHHFPRPPVAFYEMLRVARLGVVLIEPQETSRKILDHAKHFAKRVIRGDRGSGLFEPVGNYIYRTSVREVEKQLLALGCPFLAVKRFNDFYHPRLARGPRARWSSHFLLTRFGLAVQDVLSALRLLDYGMVALIVLKQQPSAEVAARLKHAGFRIQPFPQNPYIEA